MRNRVWRRPTSPAWSSLARARTGSGASPSTGAAGDRCAFRRPSGASGARCWRSCRSGQAGGPSPGDHPRSRAFLAIWYPSLTPARAGRPMGGPGADPSPGPLSRQRRARPARHRPGPAPRLERRGRGRGGAPAQARAHRARLEMGKKHPSALWERRPRGIGPSGIGPSGPLLSWASSWTRSSRCDRLSGRRRSRCRRSGGGSLSRGVGASVLRRATTAGQVPLAYRTRLRRLSPVPPVATTLAPWRPHRARDAGLEACAGCNLADPFDARATHRARFAHQHLASASHVSIDALVLKSHADVGDPSSEFPHSSSLSSTIRCLRLVAGSHGSSFRSSLLSNVAASNQRGLT